MRIVPEDYVSEVADLRTFLIFLQALANDWDEIKRIAGHNRNAPPGQPETVDHNRPPSYHIREIFRIGGCRDDYSKVRDANRILRGKDLAVSVLRCPELRAFVNTIINLCGGTTI